MCEGGKKVFIRGKILLSDHVIRLCHWSPSVSHFILFLPTYATNSGFLKRPPKTKKLRFFCQRNGKCTTTKILLVVFIIMTVPRKQQRKEDRLYIINVYIYIYILPNRLSINCRYVKAINVGCYFNSVFRNITLQNSFKPLIRFEFHHFYNKTRTYNIRFSQ